MLRLVWQDPKEKGPSVAVTSFCGEMSYSHQVLVGVCVCMHVCVCVCDSRACDQLLTPSSWSGCVWVCVYE
jgi:hypothetical protein